MSYPLAFRIGFIRFVGRAGHRVASLRCAIIQPRGSIQTAFQALNQASKSRLRRMCFRVLALRAAGIYRF